MGLFDRFRSAGPTAVGSNASNPETAEHDALRLIDEGNAIEDEGRIEEAMQRYDAAILLVPNLARAHLNRGNILSAKGDIDGALEAFGTAIKCNPNYAGAYYNLGNANARLGRQEAALDAYKNAIRLQPEYADAEVALAGVLEDIGRADEAMASYKTALTLNPQHAGAARNLERLLIKVGQRMLHAERYAELENYTRLVLEHNPDSGFVWQVLGASLQMQGKDGLPALQKVTEIFSDDADAQNNLGNALNLQGKTNDAAACYRRALEIKPDFADAHSNLGLTLKELGQIGDAVACFRRALEINPDLADVHTQLIFTRNLLVGHPPEKMLAEARHYGEKVAQKARPYTTWLNIPDPARCLRVGLVSGDLCHHPVGYFVESVLEALKAQASDRLKLFAYPSNSHIDEVTERIKVSCDDWRPAVGLSDENLARCLREDGIDILIDLSGHTAHNRLPMFAWKPVPVQVSWLGYFATTGVAAMDYLIADPWALPEKEEVYFTEKIWRLPETRLCFSPPEVNIDAAPLPALKNGYVTFGCFNNLTKMNDTVVALWARVLKAVPGSRLFLKTKQLQEASVRQRVIERFAAHGVSADRLMMEGADSRAKYLATYHKVDIALDPFPYTGGTTSVEGLWMGVPVLTLTGEGLLSRQGVGLLMNAGLSDWIALNPDDYVARAVFHATDLQRLAALRNGLRQLVLVSPIFDAQRFARHFEDALRGMWQKWCEQHA